jgi:hypothetical protein
MTVRLKRFNLEIGEVYQIQGKSYHFEKVTERGYNFISHVTGRQFFKRLIYPIHETMCFVLPFSYNIFKIEFKPNNTNNMNNSPYQNYIGTKSLLAHSEMKDGKEGYKCLANNGAEWWQDKESFEETNRPSNALTFGLAVEAMKKGRKVARGGWNEKGMWLRHVEPYNDMLIHDEQADRVSEGSTLLPWIGMKTADNKFVPWLASQTDILAEDWVIVE